MNLSTDKDKTSQLVKSMILKLKQESKKCKSIDESVDLSFSFRCDNQSIAPIQKKEEIKGLLNVLSTIKPKIVVEIGTANGGTLFLLCKVAADNSTIISVDLPEGPFGGEQYPNWKIPLYKSFVSNKQKIHLLRSDSHENKTLDKIQEIFSK